MAKLGLRLLLLFSSRLMIMSTVSQSTTNSDPAAPTNFIKSSCRTTLYPTLCFHCLSGYASKVQHSPKQMAQAALSVSLNRARSTSDFISRMTRVSGIPPREYQAVKDCVVNMGDSVGQLGKSIQELDQMGQPTDPNFTWHVSNVQTWVSAALTDENSCVDGFSDHSMDGDVKDAIKSRVIDVAQVTSNALALVNQYTERHRGHAKLNHLP